MRATECSAVTSTDQHDQDRYQYQQSKAGQQQGRRRGDAACC